MIRSDKSKSLFKSKNMYTYTLYRIPYPYTQIINHHIYLITSFHISCSMLIHSHTHDTNNEQPNIYPADTLQPVPTARAALHVTAMGMGMGYVIKGRGLGSPGATRGEPGPRGQRTPRGLAGEQAPNRPNQMTRRPSEALGREWEECWIGSAAEKRVTSGHSRRTRRRSRPARSGGGRA